MRQSKPPRNDRIDQKIKPNMEVWHLINTPRRWIRQLYQWMVGWADKPQAEKALAGLSFAESSFFPIPPDPLMIAMVTAKPKRWFRLATITTLSSITGGILGYIIGFGAITATMPILISLGYEEAYYSAVDWFARYGALAVVVAGFTPIPYKVFTIAGGAAHMFLPLFLLGSLIGRGGRFYLVAFLMYNLGSRYQAKIEKYIDILGIAFVILLVLGFVVVKYLI